MKGFPAASPLAYQDGRYYCAVPAPEGARYLAVFTEAPGPEIAYDHFDDHLERLHRAEADYLSI